MILNFLNLVQFQPFVALRWQPRYGRSFIVYHRRRIKASNRRRFPRRKKIRRIIKRQKLFNKQDNIKVTFCDVHNYDLTVHSDTPSAGTEAYLKFMSN